MKKIFLGITLALTLSTQMVFASESKVICGGEEVVYSFGGSEQAKKLNEEIELAKKDGFTQVSAPTSVNGAGTTYSLCVTVTKPESRQ
jgi:hypothetical protein